MLAESDFQLLIPPDCTSQVLTLQIHISTLGAPHWPRDALLPWAVFRQIVVFDCLGIGKKTQPKTG